MIKKPEMRLLEEQVTLFVYVTPSFVEVMHIDGDLVVGGRSKRGSKCSNMPSQTEAGEKGRKLEKDINGLGNHRKGTSFKVRFFVSLLSV